MKARYIVTWFVCTRKALTYLEVLNSYYRYQYIAITVTAVTWLDLVFGCLNVFSTAHVI